MIQRTRAAAVAREQHCNTLEKYHYVLFNFSYPLKAHSYLPQQSADSTVDCINTEKGIFLSLHHNATVHCRICTSVNEP